MGCGEMIIDRDQVPKLRCCLAAYLSRTTTIVKADLLEVALLSLGGLLLSLQFIHDGLDVTSVLKAVS